MIFHFYQLVLYDLNFRIIRWFRIKIAVHILILFVIFCYKLSKLFNFSHPIVFILQLSEINNNLIILSFNLILIMDTLSFTFDLLIFYLLRKNLSIFFQINHELSLFQNIFINIWNFQIYHWLHLKVIFRILDQTFWLNSYFITIVFILND